MSNNFFYVKDSTTGKVIDHPVSMDGIDYLTINNESEAYFAVDDDGQLLVIDGCGNWLYAPHRYKVMRAPIISIKKIWQKMKGLVYRLFGIKSYEGQQIIELIAILENLNGKKPTQD